MTRRSALLLVVLGSALSAAPPARAQPPTSREGPGEDRTHVPLPPLLPRQEQAIRGRQELAAFGIELPPGWKKVRHQAAAGEDVPESVRFEGPGGLYVHVEIDPPGQGVSADALWRCAVVDGRLRIVEEPLCDVPVAEQEEEGCSAGDGRLDVFVRCDDGARRLAFLLGHTGTDRGVDLEVFRAILASVRVR